MDLEENLSLDCEFDGSCDEILAEGLYVVGLI